MWFGTEAGLAKFDGRRTQTVNDPGLPGGRVLALQTDQSGALWIGTETGASRYMAGVFQPLKETSNQTISSIIAPERNRVLLASEQGQVFECRVSTTSVAGVAGDSITGRPPEQATTQTVLQTRPLLTQPLESADRDRPGKLVITSLLWTNDHLFAGTLSRGVLEIVGDAAKETQMRPIAYFVNALEQDKSGHLWVGVRSRKEEAGALNGSEPSELERDDAATGPVISLKTIGDDVWAGTDGRGVFRISREKTQRFTFDGTAGGLRSDHVLAIYADREGVIWFGTDRGVCRFDPQAPRVEAVGDNSDSNFVRALYQTSNGKILAGTNRGLFVYNDVTSTWKLVTDLGRNIVYALSEDKAGRLMIASASGFYISTRAADNSESQTFSRVEAGSGNADAPGSVRAVTQFRGATYFAIYGRGVEKLDGSRTSLNWPNGSSREVISLLPDGDERLLIGTANDGVLSSDGSNIRTEEKFAALKGPAVRAMARTADGSLWFGTSSGVFLCSPGQECSLIVQNIDARFLISGNNDKRNEVWCGTRGNGMLRIMLDPVVGPVYSELDSEQGLPSQNVFTILPLLSPRSVLIGTNRGVARYEPGTLEPTLYATRILSKRVHSPSELPGGLNLEYPQNSLLLDVTAISSRTFPEQFQYAFTLTDSGGKTVRQKLSRESQFTMEGLKPGKYTVIARAFTKDLTPSAPLSFSFIIARAPFPWTSTALAILLALALLALLWAILERRRIVATSAALVEANTELAGARLSLANEAERERRRIARDLHDQTLADLRHLALLTDQLDTNGENPRALRGEIESISQEVRRICEDLSPSVLQNVGFAAALEFALSHTVQDAPPEKQFEYEFHCDESLEEQSDLAPSVQMQIYRIVQEAVSNIWRHAGAKHVKMLVMSPAEGDFELQIEDDGRLFELPGRNSDGRGLANMRARAGLIDAEIRWQKRDGGGTIFTLKKTAAKELAG